MELLITGAAGFLGRALAATLRTCPSHLAAIAGVDPARARLVLSDLVMPRDLAAAEAAATTSPLTVEWRCGDLADPAFARAIVGPETVAVWHLGGVVSGAAEADLARGLRVNLGATLALLEACRSRAAESGARADPVRFVFASSIAVYGAPLPPSIDDATPAVPAMSYGAQKLACEVLLADHARRGVVDARSLRLSGVVVRPPMPNGALSLFNSDLIRETAAGRRVVSPVSPQASVWIQSVDATVAQLCHAMAIDGNAFGPARSLLMPAVATRIADVVDEVGRATGRDTASLVDWRPDPAVEPGFGRWPLHFGATRARAAGFAADASLARIVAGHLRNVRDA